MHSFSSQLLLLYFLLVPVSLMFFLRSAEATTTASLVSRSWTPSTSEELSSTLSFDNSSSILSSNLEVLRLLYSQTNGEKWAASCRWYPPFRSCRQLAGVTCLVDETSSLEVVVTIRLGECGLAGPLRGAGWRNLTELKRLELAGNRLSGSLPSQLSPSVETVDLSRNQLNGTIPSAWYTALTNLQELLLDQNLLTGSLLSFTSVVVLNVSNNLLSGTLPRIVTENSFDSSWNAFSGLLPTDMRSVTFAAAHNRLVGGLPRWGSVNIARVDVSYNQLSGTLNPFFVTASSNVDRILLNNNRLTGTIPSSWSFNGFVDLSENNLNGTLPESFADTHSMQVLFLGGNQLSGTLPQGWSVMTAFLQAINVSHNLLSGPISVETWNNTRQLVIVDFSYNQLEGPLPTFGSSVTYLRTLDLSHNAFTGTLEGAYGEYPVLTTLDLSHNRLTGSIPPMWAPSPRQTLTFFSVASNGFVGPLPRSLLKWLPNAVSIDLSNNYFEGTLPDDEWAESAPSSLLELRLDHNPSLRGAVPSAWGIPTIGENRSSFAGLQTLRLDDTRLSGTLPDSWLVGPSRQLFAQSRVVLLNRTCVLVNDTAAAWVAARLPLLTLSRFVEGALLPRYCVTVSGSLSISFSDSESSIETESYPNSTATHSVSRSGRTALPSASRNNTSRSHSVTVRTNTLAVSQSIESLALTTSEHRQSPTQQRSMTATATIVPSGSQSLPPSRTLNLSLTGSASIPVPRTPAAPPFFSAEAQLGSVMTAGAVAGSFVSATAAGVAQRSLLVTRQDCSEAQFPANRTLAPRDDDAQLPLSWNPLQLALGTGTLRSQYHKGAVVGGMVVIATLCVVAVLVSLAMWFAQKREKSFLLDKSFGPGSFPSVSSSKVGETHFVLIRAMANFSLPGRFLTVTLLLAQPILSSCIMLLASASPSVEDVFVALAGIAFLLLPVAALCRIMMPKYRVECAPLWQHSRFGAVDTCFGRRLLWKPRDEHNESVALFCSGFRIVVSNLIASRYWYFVVDLLWVTVGGVLGGIPATDSLELCLTVKYGVVVLSVLVVVTLVVIRPFGSFPEFLWTVLREMLGVAAAIASLAGAPSDDVAVVAVVQIAMLGVFALGRASVTMCGALTDRWKFFREKRSSASGLAMTAENGSVPQEGDDDPTDPLAGVPDGVSSLSHPSCSPDPLFVGSGEDEHNGNGDECWNDLLLDSSSQQSRKERGEEADEEEEAAEEGLFEELLLVPEDPLVVAERRERRLQAFMDASLQTQLQPIVLGMLRVPFEEWLSDPDRFNIASDISDKRMQRLTALLVYAATAEGRQRSFSSFEML